MGQNLQANRSDNKVCREDKFLLIRQSNLLMNFLIKEMGSLIRHIEIEIFNKVIFRLKQKISNCFCLSKAPKYTQGSKGSCLLSEKISVTFFQNYVLLLKDIIF